MIVLIVMPLMKVNRYSKLMLSSIAFGSFREVIITAISTTNSRMIAGKRNPPIPASSNCRPANSPKPADTSEKLRSVSTLLSND